MRAGDAAEAWAGLTGEERQVFLGSPDPARSLVLSLARRTVVERELQQAGYLDAPEIEALSAARLRSTAADAAAVMMVERLSEAVTDEDLEEYLGSLGTGYWFTVRPGTAYEGRFGPVNRAQIPEGRAALLDSLEPGQSAPDSSGATVRLDSLTTSPAGPGDAMVPDTAMVIQEAREALAHSRYQAFRMRTLSLVREDLGVEVDTTVLQSVAEAYPSPPPDPGAVALSSGLGDWAAGELHYEAEYLGMRMPVQPGSVTWLGYLVDNLLLQTVLVDSLFEWSPSTLDSLEEERDSWVLQLAAERLYADSVGEVDVQREDLEEQWELLPEPPVFEERRYFDTAVLPGERLEELEQSGTEGETAGLVSSLDPLDWVTGEDVPPGVIGPLRMVSVPAGAGEEAFAIPPEDTLTWHGPYPMEQSGDFLLLRLVEVVPEREATFDEARIDLEQMARYRLSEEAAAEWMQRLEERHGIVLREEVIDSLPEDPGLW